MEKVDLIAAGYEWDCPKCSTPNVIASADSIVQCVGCDCQFETNDPDHCRG